MTNENSIPYLFHPIQQMQLFLAMMVCLSCPVLFTLVSTNAYMHVCARSVSTRLIHSAE